MAIDDVIAALGGATRPAGGVSLGTLAGIREDGSALVKRAGDAAELRPARSVVPLKATDVGREVLLAFLEGDDAQPVILGVLQGGATPGAVRVEADGERITVLGGQELVLQCGKASITLTRAGKILIRGAYVLSRSSGVNRIKGGSVQIN